MFVKSIAHFVLGVVLMSAARAFPAEDNDDLTRVVGGNINIIKNFKYLMQVWKGDRFTCGASLVAPRFVVTAAHCVEGGKPSQFTVVGGASKLTDAGVRRKVSKIIKPGTFSLSNLDKDVAVFKLAKAMTGENISPIALNTDTVEPGMVMQVTGWGLRSDSGSTPANQLRTIKVPVVSKSTCRVQYQGEVALTGTMFCAAKPQHDSCSGDSGGPAVCKNKLCGIVSFGNGCARSNYPGVYTGVKSVLEFIRKAMTQ